MFFSPNTYFSKKYENTSVTDESGKVQCESASKKHVLILVIIFSVIYDISSIPARRTGSWCPIFSTNPPTYTHPNETDPATQAHTHRVHGSRRLVSIAQDVRCPWLKTGGEVAIQRQKFQQSSALYVEKKQAKKIRGWKKNKQKNKQTRRASVQHDLQRRSLISTGQKDLLCVTDLDQR